MKRFFGISLFLVAGLLFSCSKPHSFGVDAPWDEGDAVVFSASGLDTKAEVLSSLPSFNVACFTGEPGQAVRLEWRSVYVDDGKGLYGASTGDRYWPQLGDPGYRFVASNAEMSASAAGVKVVADGSLDVVAAVNLSPQPRVANGLSFGHVFARIGKVTVSEVGIHPVTEVSITLEPRTGGVYDILKGDGRNDGTGWESVSVGPAVELTPGTLGEKVNDLFLVPGTYVLNARWSVRKPNRVASFEKSREVFLEAGVVSNISTAFGTDGEDVLISVTLRDWNSREQEVEFVEEKEDE